MKKIQYNFADSEFGKHAGKMKGLSRLAKGKPATRMEELVQYLRITGYMRGKAPKGMFLPEDFLFRFGGAWPVDQRTYAGEQMTRNMCYRNASQMAFNDPALTYCEGYCHIGLLPIQHAWVLTREGIVLDPTLRRDQVDDPIYLGIAFRTHYLRSAILNKSTYGLLGIDNIEVYRKSAAMVRRTVVKPAPHPVDDGTPQSTP